MKRNLKRIKEPVRNGFVTLNKDIARDFPCWGKLSSKVKIAISIVILTIFVLCSIRFFKIYFVDTGFVKLIYAVAIIGFVVLTVFCEIDKRGWLMTTVEIVAIVVLLRVLAGVSGVDLYRTHSK